VVKGNFIWANEERTKVKFVPYIGLLQEFVGYDSNLKANIVYKKCLQNRKFEIAKQIKEKYKLVDKYDDMVMVLAIASMAQDKADNT
jgi:hypothetical protein